MLAREAGEPTDMVARTTGCLVAGALALTAALGTAPSARADDTDGKIEITGTVGCGLLGAEVVLALESAFSVQPWWAYLAGGVVGAAGGAIGGVYLTPAADGQVSSYLLAGGIVMIIPTTVAALSATAFAPPINSQPEAEQQRQSYRLAPPALLDIREGAWGTAFPALTVRDAYTRRELAEFGVRQHSELRVPVVSVTF